MVKFLFVEAFWDKEVRLNKEAITLLSKFKNAALFASVQFVKLETVKKQLKEIGINILTTKARRTSAQNQILGCDCFGDSYEDKDIFNKADAILYIGDGLFHPKALLLAQQNAEKKKDVITYDPVSDSVRILTQKDIERQKKRHQANLLKYLYAKNVGVLVSTKTGQQYLNSALALKKQSKELDKNFYIFIGDTIDFREMENFPFIECWVNTACPRIGTDDIVNIEKALININDALAYAKPERVNAKLVKEKADLISEGVKH